MWPDSFCPPNCSPVQVEVMSTDGRKSVTKYSLDPATAQRLKDGDSQVAQHASSSVEQSRLAASPGKELQVRMWSILRLCDPTRNNLLFPANLLHHGGVIIAVRVCIHLIYQEVASSCSRILGVKLPSH